MLEDRVAWFVWSTGLQTWEPISVSYKEIATFVYLHAKTIDGKHVAICVDKSGRYVGGFHS